GAHGATHRALTDLSQLEAEQEILESRQAVESWTGKTVSFFAYPEGRTSPQLRAMLVKHGFSAACTTGREVNCGDFDLFELKRIPLTREPMSRFAFRLAGLSDNWRMSLKKRGKS
ncbi:MAG: polysaccharide deacetylase family protein, partial [Kiritimatiellae bacterium]|nr:polysaccharide deacetylase family protein [Kiritimatiellia bacterium]